MEQKFIYVDANYLKELEETAKKVDYYKGIIDGINMVIDRKTDNCSEIPNNSEPQLTAKCLNCANSGSYKCNKCDGEIYFKNEPQTNKDFKVTYTCSFTDCDNFKNFGFSKKCIECKRKQSEVKYEDEPQMKRSE